MNQIREVTRRFVLQAGFSCNARCRFCYYYEDLKKGKIGNLTTIEVKKRLEEGRRLGKDQVDISGGEPTIRADIFDIITFARNIGYNKVCIITNGLKTAEKEFLDKLIDSGLNDILFSIHSPIEEEHDWVTRVKGSWKKLMHSLDNAGKTDIEYRCNTVVSEFNYKNIDILFNLLKTYNPRAINLLIYNPSYETHQDKYDKAKLIDYTKIGNYVSNGISKYKTYFKCINVRWLPFCMLKGHEEHIRTMWQKLYEDQEWDPYLNIKYNKGFHACILSFLAGFFLYPFLTPKYGRRDKYTLFTEIISTFRQIYYYRHVRECKKCSLRKICPGLANNYLRKCKRPKISRYNLDKVIKDPLFFCRDYKENFKSLRLNKN